jgi:uncharacterized protein YeaO (DUF488 family)
MKAAPASGRKTGLRLRLKRIYEPAADDDGVRILVDRLWPRGIAREKAQLDLWLKEIAPSNALRRLAHGEPDKWTEFVAAYERELEQEPAKSALDDLRKRARSEPVTLLYAARNETRNNAAALKLLLERRR